MKVWIFISFFILSLIHCGIVKSMQKQMNNIFKMTIFHAKLQHLKNELNFFTFIPLRLGNIENI